MGHWRPDQKKEKKKIINIIINSSSNNKIIDPAILNPSPEVNYEPLYICYQYVIKFLIRESIIGLCNTGHMEYRDRYKIQTKNYTIKCMKDK